MTPHDMQKLFDAPVKQLLVDLDGTLLGNRRLPLGLDFVRQALGSMKVYGGWRKAARTLMEIKGEFERPGTAEGKTNDVRVVELFARRMDLSMEEGRRVMRESVGLIFPGLKRHFYPVRGAKEFLDWAKDRYPMVLATNPVWPQEIAELRLNWAGIDPKIFRSITTVHKMTACKPAREYYEEILKQEGFQAEDCLLIGDDVKMDLPATRAGVRVFIVGNYQKTAPLKLSGSTAPAWRGSYEVLKKALE